MKRAASKAAGRIAGEAEKVSEGLKKLRGFKKIKFKTQRLVKKFLPKKRYRKIAVVDVEELAKKQGLTKLAGRELEKVIGGARDTNWKPVNSDFKWSNHGYKHFPEKNISWSQIVKSTKNGPAKYSNSIKNIEEFEREVWNTGKSVNNNKNWRIKAYDKVIGACNGKETMYVRVENSSNTIHGHPITKEEYLKLSK